MRTKRLLALALSVLLFLGVLASCGEQPAAPEELSSAPASSEPVSDEPDQTDPDQASSEEPETDPYVPPEEREYLICGTSLREYTIYIYFAQTEGNTGMMWGFGALTPTRKVLTAIAERYLGFCPEIKVLRNERMLPESGKQTDHEILFGIGFERSGIPEYTPGDVRYGITEDGTVYFQNPSINLCIYLWKEFLGEISGVPYQSERECYGFSAGPCTMTVPRFTRDDVLDLGYEPVFEENFEGTEELDWNVWKSYVEGPLLDCFVTKDQAFIRDGKLVLSAEWKEDGEYGAGWYVGHIGLQEKYCRGYYEMIMKCSPCKGRSTDFWSAFWLVDHTYPSAGGPGGCEIDIVENFGPHYQTSCFWVSETEEEQGLSSELYEGWFEETDFSAEYHTYGLLWDEDCYKIYVDGVLFAASDYAYGTSEVPETVWLGICVPSAGPNRDPDQPVEMVVEEMGIWQKP